jgi:hypothetical protein
MLRARSAGAWQALFSAVAGEVIKKPDIPQGQIRL